MALCCLQGGHTHTWLNSLDMQSQFAIKEWLLCSVFTTVLWLSIAFQTLGHLFFIYLFFSGTVWPSIRRLWKGSPVEWRELQSTVQESKIFKGVGETSRGLRGCCQMFSSSASGKVFNSVCVFYVDVSKYAGETRTFFFVVVVSKYFKCCPSCLQEQ